MQAGNPFAFHTRLNLSELTGLKAYNLEQLLACIQKVPGSSIYHHTHRFLQQHQYLSPEPPNDFSYWIHGILGESELSENLVSIDTVEFSSIHELRQSIVKTIQDYLGANPSAKLKFASEGAEFYFIKSVSFVVTTSHVAYNLADFVRILSEITVDSIYFHVFEARLRLGRKTNDFSYWIESSLGDAVLADEISRLDPYSCTMEDLRRNIIQCVERRIQGAA